MFNEFRRLGTSYKVIDGHRVYYYNCCISLDIKVSSGKDINDKDIAVPYLWYMNVTIGDYENLLMGRTLEELQSTLNDIYSDAILASGLNIIKLPVYVYDLTYLNYFLEPLLGKITDKFDVKGNLAFVDYNYRFRFKSVKTFNVDSREFIKNDIFYDNSIMRTPLTDLDEADLQECLAVVLGIDEYIKNFVSITDKYNFFDLPVSISRTIKDRMYYWGYKLVYYRHGKLEPFMNESIIPIQDVREWKIIHESISGGICAYNKDKANEIIEQVVGYDFTSCYPAIMFCSNLFPVKFHSYYETMDSDEYLKGIKNYAIISNIWLKNVRLKDNCPTPFLKCDSIREYDESKCKFDDEGYLIDTNGTDIKISGCEMDYYTLRNFYDFDGLVATDCYVYERGLLPNRLVGCMMQYFKDKCQYKDDKNMLALYLMSKRCINMCFGINYTDPCTIYPDFDNGKLDLYFPSYDTIKAKIKAYNESKSRTTCYQWGMYIAAIQRARLSIIIKKAIDLGIWLYSDTDSCYVKFDPHFHLYVKHLNEINFKRMQYIGNIRDNYSWSVNNKILGNFGVDSKCYMFKMLGRKTYMYSDELGEVTTKTAGIPSSELKKLFKRYDCQTAEDKFNIFKKSTILKDSIEYYNKINETLTTVEDYQGHKSDIYIKGGVVTKHKDDDFKLTFEEKQLLFILDILGGANIESV